MAKLIRPYVMNDNWYRVPENYSARITTEQWREMLLNERDTFMAVGHLWQLKATRVGPGVYEIKASRKNP